MATTVAGKQQLSSVTDLLDRLDRLREAGAEVHNIWKSDPPPGGSQDSFHITYSNGGARFVGEFSLPKQEADFLAGAISAGFVSAEAVNSGQLGETLLNYAAVHTGRPAVALDQLRVDRGAGKGS